MIRVGGNTSDFSLFSADGAAKAEPKSTVINDDNLKDLGTFLAATGWDLIWGLNLGGGTEHDAVEEAKAVMAVAKTRLVAFEIGNEPDLFGRGTAHRLKNYNYADYLREYRRFRDAIRREIPNARFAGPDAAVETDWVTQFAADEGNDLRLLTHHYYRECNSPTATLNKLLNTDPKLQPMLDKLKAASTSSHVPYRICETNSFRGGGKPGVSNTFGAALWALDFMFRLAAADAAGINLETGVNQLGFISSYSPLFDDGHRTYSAAPEYYGMLAFAHGSHGRLVHLTVDPASSNLGAYAVLDGGRLSVTLINKDPGRTVDTNIVCDQRFSRASILRLTAPSLQSTNGVTLGGAAVNSAGVWEPTQVEKIAPANGKCSVHIAAASAAVVTLEI